ncbi:MAG TPA: dihydroorotate dehydrogenase-like protein [Gammaproteobacteria bacterium]
MDLRTHYLGIELKNPLVPSASPLSRSLDTARQLEDAGAAALVMYSLFEEELRSSGGPHYVDIGHTEARSYMPEYVPEQGELERHLEQLQRLKLALAIPVIASLNGISLDGWVENGKLLAEAGADALELNAYFIAADLQQSSVEVEQRYLSLLAELRSVVSIPITMKLSPYFSSLGHMVKALEAKGANGVALFNRFYQPDIDIDSLQVASRLQLSHPGDHLLAMRWIAMLQGRTQLSLAATSGVHTSDDAVKMVLAGADVVHLCSTLLLHGPRQLSRILAGMERWLDESPYESLEQCKGVMSQRQSRDPSAFERANYVQLLGGYSVSKEQWR